VETGGHRGRGLKYDGAGECGVAAAGWQMHVHNLRTVLLNRYVAQVKIFGSNLPSSPKLQESNGY